MYVFILIFDFLNNLFHNVNKIVLVLNTIFFEYIQDCMLVYFICTIGYLVVYALVIDYSFENNYSIIK